MMLWERKNEAIAVESLERSWHRDQSIVFQRLARKLPAFLLGYRLPRPHEKQFRWTQVARLSGRRFDVTVQVDF